MRIGTPNDSTSKAEKKATKQIAPDPGDPWLWDAVQAIAAHRTHFVAGDEARGLLDTAETLAVFLARIPQDRRPQLLIDPDGRPSFATSVDGFYIDLTLDSLDSLSWYAVVNDKESYAEGAAFDGRRLPQGLKDLFALQAASAASISTETVAQAFPPDE